ncbi:MULTISPECIES: helix-turn-helix domain-containing protein [Streptomyces]|uniref:helix-turn-helix domain-containing protein n=1 Tax=Streptomyces TaxID=1883 RepID=UPI00345BD19B
MLTMPPSELGAVIKAARRKRGWTQKNLADQLNRVSGWGTCTANDVYRWETGRRKPGEWLPHLATVLELDLRPPLALTGETMPLAGNIPYGTPVSVEDDPMKRRALFSMSAAALATLSLGRGQRVVEALDVVNQDSPGSVADNLSELIDHYSLAICAAPPDAAYDEIFAVRSYVSEILKGSRKVPQHKDISLHVGWLSCLLGIAACDAGDHAAAHIWCADAERRSQEARHPELAGWAVLTRSMIAFYQGQPRQSVLLASKGRDATAMGTSVHAKLAAQEMRAAAMAGDVSHTEAARRYATKALVRLAPGSKETGAFSIAPAEEPPYTATSLLLLGQFRESVSATNRVLQTHYQHEARKRGEQPSGYARALLILGLAHAGSGNLDEAVSAGHAALAGKRPAWPTLALAGKLDRALERDFANAQQAEEYRVRYLEATHRLQLLAPTGE